MLRMKSRKKEQSPKFNTIKSQQMEFLEEMPLQEEEVEVWANLDRIKVLKDMRIKI
jgi:hypothetical protein